jgi:competence protein ComEA
MDRPLPWRVLEDGGATDLPTRPAASGTAPTEVAATASGSDPARRMLALAAAAGAAVVVGALVLVLGGSTSPTLVLPAASPPPLEMSRLGAEPSAEAGGPTAGDAAVLVVDVAGAVRHPGVYRLPEGSRVVDAIAAAGGYGPRVDAVATSHLNLAAPVRDGEQVRVPSRDDPPAASGGAAASGATAPVGDAASPGSRGEAPVDLNTASADELDTLPGVGPVTAAKIIAAREEAPFATVADLRSRGVVGEATFRKLEGLVTVGP